MFRANRQRSPTIPNDPERSQTFPNVPKRSYVSDVQFLRFFGSVHDEPETR